MSSYMYSNTHSLMTRCGPSRTTTCTFHYEADAPWGRILTQMSLRNQPPKSDETAVGLEDLQPLPSSATTAAPEDLGLEPAPSDEIMAENSHQPDMHLDEAGNEPDTSTDTDDLPDVSIDRPLRVPFGNELRYAPTMAELIRCRRHRDGTLQSVPLPKVLGEHAVPFES